MQFFLFFIRSIRYFIRQEKKLFCWIFLGMAAASAMLLICSGYYFEKSTTSETTQFYSNRYSFTFEKVTNAVELVTKLEEDEKVRNVQVLLETEEAVTLGSWYQPDEAYLKEKIMSGRWPTVSGDGKNWCMISFWYKQEQDFMEYETPVVGEKMTFLNAISCDIIAMIRDTDDDFLISMNCMKDVLNLCDDAELNMKIAYVYSDEASEMELEELNEEIIDLYHPVNVYRPERTEKYTFAGFLGEMSSMILLLLMAVINYMMIYYFWLKKRSHVYRVCRICGLSLGKMIGMLMAEQFLMFLFIHIAVSICVIAVKYIFLNGQEDIYMMVQQSVYAGILLALLNVLVFVFTEAKTVRYYRNIC